MNKLVDKIAYGSMCLAIGTLSRLPFPVLHLMSDMIAPFLHHVVRYRRKVVRKNLGIAFPNKSEAERREIERKFYRSFTDTILEAVKLYSISDRQMMRHAVFTNADEVHELIKEGKSLSVYIGHYGNWEWISSIGLWFPPEEIKIIQIYHRLKNENVGRIVEHMRTRFHDHSVDMQETARYIAQAHRDNEQLMIGFIADQSPKRRDARHFLDFFGHSIPVLTGTEKLTKHFNHHALYMTARRVKRGYYEYEIKPLCENPEALPDFELTALYFKKLQEEIERCPELYLWSHNRFKFEAKPAADSPTPAPNK